jgi:hypothetical protein
MIVATIQSIRTCLLIEKSMPAMRGSSISGCGLFEKRVRAVRDVTDDHFAGVERARGTFGGGVAGVFGCFRLQHQNPNPYEDGRWRPLSNRRFRNSASIAYKAMK